MPLLVERGHGVVGMKLSPQKEESVHALGAEPVLADAFEREAAIGAVECAGRRSWCTS